MDLLFSVIVPIYNQEPYIAQCLESLFNQKTEQTEFLLMDDGSTDNSAEICRSYMERYPVRARLIQQENHGLLETRKRGIAQASGEYILCVDSDDCMMEGALEALTGVVEERHPDIVLFNATNDLESGRPLFRYSFGDGTVFEGEDKYELYRLLCCTDRLNNIWAKCVRRELFELPEVYEDIAGISNGEDLYQSLPLIDHAVSTVYLDRVLYYYRVNSSSMSRSYNPKHFASEKKVCARRMEYASRWDRGDGELISGAKNWICRILRDVSRKLFVSDLGWERVSGEFRDLRNDGFYREYYYKSDAGRDVRDIVLKSPLPVMRVWKALYGLKPRR